MIVYEELRPGFMKILLNRDGEEGWPWRPVLHRISAPEELPHDHPGNITSTIVRGEGYIEEQFVLMGRGKLMSAGLITRRLGQRFEIKGETIHRIVEVLGGECWSLVEHEPNRREWKTYTLPA